MQTKMASLLLAVLLWAACQLAITQQPPIKEDNNATVPMVTLVCIPPCPDGGVICTWNNGGNGYNGSEDCQRKCGSPVGNNEACKDSANKTCWWGWTKSAGWACFSGPPPCSDDGDVILSAYMTCAELQSGYGGCPHTADCTGCCSKKCHCQDLIEDKSECLCGAG